MFHGLKQPGPKRKRGRKSVTKTIDPTRTEVTDVRRTYSQLMLNAFNSCDARKLYKAFATYCTPDFYSELKYDGVNNPFASKVIATKGLEQHVILWTALSKSVPDFLFEGEFEEAYISKVSADKRCVVRSKITMNGTRVLDLKFARRVNAQVIKRKLKNKDDYPTSENELMAQIHQQLAESYRKSTADAENEPLGEETHYPFPEENGETGCAARSDDTDGDCDDRALLAEYGLLGEAVEDTQGTMPAADCVFNAVTEQPGTVDGAGVGIFDGDGDGAGANMGEGEEDEEEGDIEIETIVQEVVEPFFEGDVRSLFDNESTIYPDSKPMPRSLRICIAGFFTVWIDPTSGKIDEMQLLYSAVDTAEGTVGEELAGI